MVHKSCFICCKQCITHRDGVKDAKTKGVPGFAYGSKLDDNQLQVMFLLRKLLEIPEDTCCKLSKHFGNPDLWMKCCKSCSVLVDKCQTVIDQIVSLEKHYDELRMDIKYKILKSQRHFDSEYQCEDIVRSHIISKDIDYFISTTASRKAKEGNVETSHASASPSQTEETYSDTECDQLLTIDPLTTEEETVDSINQDAGKSGSSCNFVQWDFDKSEQSDDYEIMITKNPYGHQEMDEEEIEIKPLDLIVEEKTQPIVLPLLKPHDSSSESNSKPRVHKKHFNPTCKRFTSGKILHRKTSNTSVKPVKCDICGKLFGKDEYLKNHMSVHTGAKEHRCDMCGHPFRQSGLLRRHEKTVHTTDRKYPFACVMCGESYNEKKSLKQHYRKHTEEKEKFFKCLICGESFTIVNGLKLHNMTHSEKNPSS